MKALYLTLALATTATANTLPETYIVYDQGVPQLVCEHIQHDLYICTAQVKEGQASNTLTMDQRLLNQLGAKRKAPVENKSF